MGNIGVGWGSGARGWGGVAGCWVELGSGFCCIGALVEAEGLAESEYTGAGVLGEFGVIDVFGSLGIVGVLGRLRGLGELGDARELPLLRDPWPLTLESQNPTLIDTPGI